MGPIIMADSAKQSVKSTAQQAKDGASAAVDEVKKGTNSDKSMGSAISDAGTEAKRAAKDTGRARRRGRQARGPHEERHHDGLSQRIRGASGRQHLAGV